MSHKTHKMDLRNSALHHIDELNYKVHFRPFGEESEYPGKSVYFRRIFEALRIYFIKEMR